MNKQCSRRPSDMLILLFFSKCLYFEICIFLSGVYYISNTMVLCDVFFILFCNSVPSFFCLSVWHHSRRRRPKIMNYWNSSFQNWRLRCLVGSLNSYNPAVGKYCLLNRHFGCLEVLIYVPRSGIRGRNGFVFKF